MENSDHITGKIIEKCLEGDIKAQYRLYKEFSKAMYNIAIRILNSKMDAEDVLQESFVKAFSELGNLNNRDLFPAWLKRIVINNCISFIRKKKIRESSLPNLPEEEDVPEPDQLDPAIVHQAIKNLPDRGRAILVLHALEGYKHREIAEMLGISESTSKTQYSRALSILKKELKEVQYAD